MHVLTLAAQGSIAGVMRTPAGEAVPGAQVEIVGTAQRTTSRDDGGFRLLGVSPGSYRVRARAVGFSPAELDDVVVSDSAETRVTITLERAAVPLAAVVVTPGRTALVSDVVSARVTLSRADIESRPQAGDDFYRAISRLPGLASNDFSARFAVRGSANQETLARLDGLELYEPFHLRDYDGALSVIDAGSIRSAQL